MVGSSLKMYAMGSVGGLSHDFSGLASRMPLPVLVLVLIVLAMAAYGLISRLSSIVKGKGTATDYLGIMILIGFLLLVMLLVASGMLGGMRYF